MRAAAENGTLISKLCAIDNLVCFGSCRLFLVEIDDVSGAQHCLGHQLRHAIRGDISRPETRLRARLLIADALWAEDDVRHQRGDTELRQCRAWRRHPADQGNPDRRASGVRQPLNAEMGAGHGAAFCMPDGAIMMVRENVGQHNALDKLIGASVRRDQPSDGPFSC